MGSTNEKAQALVRAVEYLARELAEYRCRACGGHDEHDRCDEPDWVGIGREMQRLMTDHD